MTLCHAEKVLLNPLGCCLLCSGDCAVPSRHPLYEQDTVPAVCTMLPLVAVYPQFDICTAPARLYPDREFYQKGWEGNLICSCCVPYACAANCYGQCIEACWLNEGSQTCCCGSDCALPCLARIPFLVNVCGLNLKNPAKKFGCCLPLDDLLEPGYFDER
mmetsp:Transcript_21544/g.65843  ORF Transcript_21544/g.65843 Transcript_21544/m.65843 type:complete len:160 (-) Transcript_21544:533-1012(-)